MTTTTKQKAGAAAIEEPLHAAVAATSELREAREASARAEHALILAVADEKEAARRAFVAGVEHEANGQLVEAQRRRVDAKQRADDAKAADDLRQAELVQAVQELLDAGGGGGLAAAIEPMVDAGQKRLDEALDELGAARRQLGYSIALAQSVGTGRAKVFVPARLDQVDGLVRGNGEAVSWMVVEGALRGLGAQAREGLAAVASWTPPWQPRVSQEEILEWALAAGMSASDSVGDLRAAYLERGPRSHDAWLDDQDRAAKRAGTQAWTGVR